MSMPYSEAAYENLFGTINRNISRINQLCNELSDLRKFIGDSTKNVATKSIINSKAKSTNGIINETSSLFVKLASNSVNDSIIRSRAESCKKDFQKALQKFKLIQADIKSKISANAANSNVLRKNIGENSTCDEAQLLKSEQDTKEISELASAMEQEEQMRNIESDILNVEALYQRMNELVYEQRSNVENIEDAITTAYDQQVAGNEQLATAVRTRNRMRKRCVIISIVIVIILLIVALILFIRFYRPHNTKMFK